MEEDLNMHKLPDTLLFFLSSPMLSCMRIIFACSLVPSVFFSEMLILFTSCRSLTCLTQSIMEFQVLKSSLVDSLFSIHKLLLNKKSTVCLWLSANACQFSLVFVSRLPKKRNQQKKPYRHRHIAPQVLSLQCISLVCCHSNRQQCIELPTLHSYQLTSIFLNFFEQ